MNATAKFLSRYAAVILAAGSSSARCEKTVYRMAKSFGYDVDLTILPRSIMMTVRQENSDQTYTVNEKIPAMGFNFYFISSLTRLSWDIRDRGTSLEDAEKEFERISSAKRLNPILVTILTGLANASFCRLFEGDLLAMLIVFIASLILRIYIQYHFHPGRGSRHQCPVSHSRHTLYQFGQRPYSWSFALLYEPIYKCLRNYNLSRNRSFAGNITYEYTIFLDKTRYVDRFIA